MQVIWVQSLGPEDPLEKELATHSSTLAWKSHGQRSLGGCSPWGHKELDRELYASFSFGLQCHNFANLRPPWGIQS